MAVTPKQTEYISLESYPKHQGTYSMCSNILKLNENEFIVIHRTHIHKYNVIMNEWQSFHADVKHLTGTDYGIAYDQQQQKLLVTGESNTVQIFSIQNDMECIEYPLRKVDCSTSLIVTNRECHIIGGINNDSHSIWDMNTDNKPRKIHTFKDSAHDGFKCLGWIYIERKDEIYLFGGYRIGTNTRSTEIRRYCVKTQKWSILSEELSVGKNYCGVAVGSDQRYVVILGGYDQNSSYLDDIQVFDVDVCKLYKCNIKLPFTGACKAVVMENKTQNKLLVKGYLRKYCMKTDVFPLEIMELIMKWHSTEWVHVIHPHDDARYIKINLDTIINSIIG